MKGIARPPSSSSVLSAMIPCRAGERPVTIVAWLVRMAPGEGGIAAKPVAPSRARRASDGMCTSAPSAAA